MAYNDIGGRKAGKVVMVAEHFPDWARRSEAMRGLLGDAQRRMLTVDEMRRAYESYGEEIYTSLDFYPRRLEAMLHILEEKGIVSREELEARIAQIAQRAPAGDGR